MLSKVTLTITEVQNLHAASYITGYFLSFNTLGIFQETKCYNTKSKRQSIVLLKSEQQHFGRIPILFKCFRRHKFEAHIGPGPLMFFAQEVLFLFYLFSDHR